MEPTARFEELRITLEEPVHGLESVSGVLGIPEWWPTGARVAVILAHASGRDLSDPLLEGLHYALTERRYLTLRFNFPFAEAKKKRPDPPAVLGWTYRAAMGALGRDPTAAPAHLFVGGVGLGAQVAAQVATARLRADGAFFLAYPLHARDDPEKNLRVEPLFRIVCPMLFVQGTRDRHCDLPVLRKTLARVGAPTTLQVVADADQRFHVPKRTGRTTETVLEEILETLDGWFQRLLGL